MTAKRTIVGSPPHRRVLEGREAIERAVRHCEFWGKDWPGHASCTATLALDIHQHRVEPTAARWLPRDVAHEDVADLRRALAEVRP